MRLMAEATATLEPEMALNSTQVVTVASPNPPMTQLTMASANSKSWRTMPVRSMRKPAKMNSGTAIRL